MSIFQRFACQYFDKGSGAELVRLQSDGQPTSGSPHIFAEEINRHVFPPLFPRDQY